MNPSTLSVTGWVYSDWNVAFHNGRRGHPVGFSAACYEKLAALSGDEGAKAVVAAYADELAHVDVDDPGTARDVDTPADLQK